MNDTGHPLISAGDLLAAIDDPGIRIADVRWFPGEPGRGQLEHRRDHIPGAVFVDLDRDLAAPPGDGRHPLPDPIAFADRMGELGFGDGHTGVIHDDSDGPVRRPHVVDARPARSQGLVMLDGGITAWKASDGG